MQVEFFVELRGVRMHCGLFDERINRFLSIKEVIEPLVSLLTLVQTVQFHLRIG